MELGHADEVNDALGQPDEDINRADDDTDTCGNCTGSRLSTGDQVKCSALCLPPIGLALDIYNLFQAYAGPTLARLGINLSPTATKSPWTP